MAVWPLLFPEALSTAFGLNFLQLSAFDEGPGGDNELELVWDSRTHDWTDE